MQESAKKWARWMEIYRIYMIRKGVLHLVIIKGLAICTALPVLSGFSRGQRQDWSDSFSVQNSSQVLEKDVEWGVVSIDCNSVND
jgi:hypothetical protein